MTKISFFKTKDKYTGFEISGHTGYANSGKDILCSALSSTAQSCVIGITKVLSIKAKVIKNDNEGYLKIELPNQIANEQINNAQILFETLYLSIIDLMEGYSKYISMEVIENVY